MRYALIKDGVVFNTILLEDGSDWAPDEGVTAVKSETANIGDSYDGETFTSPPVTPSPPIVPETLTRWQFFATAALAGIITQEAAQAALSGTMPQPFVDFIATLPEADRFPATMLLAGTQEFHRHHPFVQAFIASQGMTAAQADAIWTQGATLS